jgi:hypothetical protein
MHDGDDAGAANAGAAAGQEVPGPHGRMIWDVSQDVGCCNNTCQQP